MTDSCMTNKQIDLCIKEISCDNRDSLKRLYDEFKKPIFMFALSIVKDYQLAEDVMHDTFLNIMACAKNYRLGTNPKAWIFSIVRNVSVDHFKKQRKDVFMSSEEIEIISDVKFEFQSNNTIDSINALEILEPIEREIVSMYIFGGLKQTEIAKVIKLPYISVRSKYGYAIKKLKKYFSD
jgi:RNA polymerase sigma factor (sigma-70 family)